MTRVQLPAATNLSIAQFGDVFLSQGFIIEQLTDDRLQAQAPRLVYSDIFPFERWFPAARIIVERSAAGFTISHRPPIRRLVIPSLACGLLVLATVPGAMATRFWLAAARRPIAVTTTMVARRPASGAPTRQPTASIRRSTARKAAAAARPAGIARRSPNAARYNPVPSANAPTPAITNVAATTSSV
jgi:hypothetical protein